MSPGKAVDPDRSPEDVESKRILVVCETWEGRVTPLSPRLLGEARAIGQRTAGFHEVYAVVFGKAEDLGSTLGPCGAARVFRCPVASSSCDPSLVVGIVEQLAREHSAWIVLFARSPWTEDMAPRVAISLQAPLISNCVRVDWSREKGLSALQAIHGGRLHRECSVSGDKPIIISWNPESLGRYERQENVFVDVEDVSAVSISRSDGARSVRIIQGDPETMSIEEADRVLAFGRGMDHDDLPGLRELARQIRASMGGTRPVIDAGFLPFERQIGQTGTRVSPRLLLAWGISGAKELTDGIEDAQMIIAVNKDAQARIFSFSDLALVGDGKSILKEVLSQFGAPDTDLGTGPKEAP
jgi:electron transfer flavoprotein alpha subunit